MRKVILGILGAIALPVAAYADHSLTMFDLKATKSVKGVVKQFQYTDPHSWLLVEVKDADGAPQLWSFEAGPRSTLLRQGVKPGTFAPGEAVTVRSHPMKDGRAAGQLIAVDKARTSGFCPRRSEAPSL